MSASVPLRRASGGGDDAAQHSDHENAPVEQHHHHHRYISSDPNPSNEQHLFTLAALLLIGFVTIFSLYQLTGIFVPFLVSFFLAQLLEPVALWLAKPRAEVAKYIWHREYITGVEEVEVADAALGPVILEQVIEGAGNNLGSLDLMSDLRTNYNAFRRTYIVLTDILILLFCLALLFGVVFWLVFGLTNALSDAPEVFQTYLNGGKLKALIAFLEQHGVNVTPEDLIKRVEGPLESIVGGLLNFLETSIMVIMMLCFLLVASLTESHPKLNITAAFSPQTFFQQARRTVQLFIVLKTFCSVLEGMLVGALLAAVKVDFWFVFAVITFLMNYIPALMETVAEFGPDEVHLAAVKVDFWFVFAVITFLMNYIPALMKTTGQMVAVEP
eukprot:g11915.t1